MIISFRLPLEAPVERDASHLWHAQVMLLELVTLDQRELRSVLGEHFTFHSFLAAAA